MLLPSPLALVPPDSPVLRTFSRPVSAEDMTELTDPKFLYRVDKFRRQQGGVGIAAPQLGDPRAWFCWAPAMGDPHGTLAINPAVLWRSEHTERDIEGCLSFPGSRVSVARPVEIEVAYTDERGLHHTRHLHYRTARIFLHEFDHLNGTCIVP